MGPLGRVEPPDREHEEKYPLTAEVKAEITEPRAIVIGIDWHPEFDRPEKDSQGHWWVARKGLAPNSRPRGGHALALKPRKIVDLSSWYGFYDQVSEGICVSEGVARMSSLHNRRMYQPRWLYDRCKERDGIPDEEGTFVRTGLSVAKDLGLVKRKPGEKHVLQGGVLDGRTPDFNEGIAAYRWARSIQDALDVLGYGDLDYVDMLNSWGRQGYPHIVRMPAAVLDVLRRRGGEIGIPTDR